MDRYGNFSPNKSHPVVSLAYTQCTDSPCLFDVVSDKTEHIDVYASNPAVVKQLLARWNTLMNTYHPPPNPAPEEYEYCNQTIRNRGFVGPWH